jgi:hypothetical protein
LQGIELKGIARKCLDKRIPPHGLDLCDGRGLFFAGLWTPAHKPICAFLYNLHNFLPKISLNFVHLDFPKTLDKFIKICYNTNVVKGRGKQPKRMAQMERQGKNRALQ